MVCERVWSVSVGGGCPGEAIIHRRAVSRTCGFCRRLTVSGRVMFRCFFFQAEDGIRDDLVTGVQTCALPISPARPASNSLAHWVCNGGFRREPLHGKKLKFPGVQRRRDFLSVPFDFFRGRALL